MVKINISIEGEDVSEVASELVKMLGKAVKSNRPLIHEILEVIGDEALSVLMERKMLDKGGELYTEIMHAINWQYKKKKNI